jgi:hypothetical protein
MGIPTRLRVELVSPFLLSFEFHRRRVSKTLRHAGRSMRRDELIIMVSIIALSALCFTRAPSTERRRERIDLVGSGSTAEPVASGSWERSHVKAIDGVRDVAPGAEGADLLAFYFDERTDELAFRVSMVEMQDPATGVDLFERDRTKIIVLLDYADAGESSLPFGIPGTASIAWDEAVILDPFAAKDEDRARSRYASPAVGTTASMRRGFVDPSGEYFEGSVSLSPAYLRASSAAVPRALGADASTTDTESERRLVAESDATPIAFEILAVTHGIVADRLRADNSSLAGDAHCAFVHHGNQGLAYSDVFYGRSADPEGSGFDEALQVHQATSIPGNFHLAATLQTSAEWNHNNGDPIDFNGWLAAGVAAGWCGMVTSAYAQHMMPFVRNEMNDWAVNIETQMTNTRYGYYPRVAWVPERVWLDPFVYPNAGVNDNPVDNFVSHGVWAVILDGDVHGQGYETHQIHTIAGSSLKVMLRDRDFTGKIVGGNGAGALQVLTNLANSGVGDYRIALYAEDWEAVAEMGSWAGSTPFAKETYDWFINKCAAESAWLHVWKVADALSNPNFQGSTSMNLTYGTYQEIGGTSGYGGGNNGWYTHWAGYIPYANGGDGNGSCDPGRGGNCKNFGTLWNDAYNALMAAPDNSISQAGWYVFMTNLHETGWHDYMGGPISGWELSYSAHIKNASVYAEASHWANGEYASATGAYFSDIDNDGYQELVMHNDRVFAVFESIGARAVNVFAKGSDYNCSIIGVDNAYWSGTQADYNDANHVGALSDVGPNYQHSLYQMEVTKSSGSVVEAVFTYQTVKKTVRLTLGSPYLDVVYEVGPSMQYIQSGYSPDLVDLVWNANMDRIWVSDIAYMGQRNPNTGAAAAFILGGGGGIHNKEISGTIMKGDEIDGSGTFEFLLYAGKTSAPGGGGEIAELRALANALADTIGPDVTSAVYYPGTDKLKINFNQVVKYTPFNVTGISIDDNDDGAADLTLSSETQVIETENGFSLTLQLTSSDAIALELLNTTSLELMMESDVAFDVSDNGNNRITNDDNKKISFGPPTLITIDGYIDLSEWDHCTIAVNDSNDSQWTSANEIQALSMTWDSLYLYLAVDGIATANSWLLYIDADPNGPNGQTDLTAIDAWERGAVFTYPGFKADFQYGCYQHQGPYDGNNLYRIESATSAVNISGSVLMAFDYMHAHGSLGGSELAIPWDVLYGLGDGIVPANAQLSIVASLCWDPEPDGVLGGDVAPNNISATLPTVDNAYTATIDVNGDGKPDLPDHTPPTLVSAVRDVSSDTLVAVEFSETVDGVSAEIVSNYAVFETSVPSHTVDILGANLQPDGKTVILALEQGIGIGYSLSVSFVCDASCYRNVIEPLSTIVIDATTGADVPAVFAGALFQNYPNPFNPSTVISFEVPGTAFDDSGGGMRSAEVVPMELAIYDVNGRLVRVLIYGLMTPGPHRVTWNGVNEQGMKVSSGIYFCRMKSAGLIQTRKMVLLR